MSTIIVPYTATHVQELWSISAHAYAITELILSHITSIIDLEDEGVDPSGEVYELKLLVLSLVSRVKDYTYIDEIASELADCMGMDIVRATKYYGENCMRSILNRVFTAMLNGKSTPAEVREALIDLATALSLDLTKAPKTSAIITRGSARELKSLLLLMLITSVKLDRHGGL